MPATNEATKVSWLFLTETEAETVDAVSARIFPSGDGKPGARETRVITYIDKTTADEDEALRRCYRDGVEALNALTSEQYGQRFAELPEERQDEVLERIEASTAPESTRTPEGPEDEGLLATFFALVWEHTIQGMFCDPQYGGNHEALGWQLVGFPGAQWGYNAEQMRAGFDSKTIPIKTLEDLRRELKRADD
ncbi:gluconate 2-dehydrogenase subunit 3 family protein [Pseudarthrobacter sp. C4D7]|uniref:gluconate 2-dehydrogenase subunit 3 family protein n=1 Tax=Pseudarthrobacter sp. C4D7 TaxID=2735268 RepID=UPI001585212A|nr:gluconate 2-dehydrogenase subunit 3 family protein [Pseudarthrobacter sp. C4D7]NUT73274.1 gluconate 2-dehydrogenase subunit 3 family protein [Pseudarthrobacter sp. C4D7]